MGLALTVLARAVRAACQRPLDINSSGFYESAAAWRADSGAARPCKSSRI